MRRKYAIGNWKMNGSFADLVEIDEIAHCASKCSNIKTVICPPLPYLAACSERANGYIGIGGQDCHFSEKGAHTGDISAGMLRDTGAGYVILGHSERRTDHGETNAIVTKKAQAATNARLTPIICVGETQHERENGAALRVVETQIKESFSNLTDASGLILAYEPVWAIGTGLIPTMDQIREMFEAITNVIKDMDNHEKMPLLYGGSVNGDNADEIFSIANISGALVGGASLTYSKFMPIMKALNATLE